MSQKSWIFLDESGGQHRIGLFHGSNSGHVLIYCNGRIVTIDFSVYQTRTYTFFINDELCEVQLDRVEGGYTYTFEVNKTADTPKNKSRRKRERKYLFYSIGMLFILVLFVLLSVWILH